MSRTYTRDEVQQVVTSMVGNPDCRTHGVIYDTGWDRSAREVLRRLDALPNPPAAPESSAHARPNVETPLPSEQRDAMNAMIHDSPLGHLMQRPRAATPTPEVPALAPVPGMAMPPPAVQQAILKAMDEIQPPQTREEAEQILREAGMDPVEVLAGMRELVARVRARLAAKPAGPEVVWSGDSVCVSVRPDLGVVVSHSGEPLTPAQMASALNQAVSSLYGALAEAKREHSIAVHRSRSAYSAGWEGGATEMRERAKRIAGNVGFKNLAAVIAAADLGRPADDATARIRKSVESMRERAAAESERLAKSGVAGVEGFKTGMAIARAIRALPLEGE